MTTIGVEEDFLADHLAELPADGNRYELVDGLLLVSPALAERHQRVLSELSQLTRASVPIGLRVSFAPLDVRLSDGCRCSPICWQDGPARDQLDRWPLLCVELLSPSTRRHDLVPSVGPTSGPASRRTESSTRPSPRWWRRSSGTGLVPRSPGSRAAALDGHDAIRRDRPAVGLLA
ncbi:MAG: Uma2 family endonuclease [Frankiales bacterium]|nr:Uma2 family endonuclease [Frankiales bacterium]